MATSAERGHRQETGGPWRTDRDGLEAELDELRRELDEAVPEARREAETDRRPSTPLRRSSSSGPPDRFELRTSQPVPGVRVRDGRFATRHHNLSPPGAELPIGGA